MTLLNPELMGPLAAIGIIKGEPFAPDGRMKKVLTEALALANATSRSLLMHPRDPTWFYYPDSAWWNSLFVTGYEFETPIPMIEGPVLGGERIPTGGWIHSSLVGLTPESGRRRSPTRRIGLIFLGGGKLRLRLFFHRIDQVSLRSRL